MKSIGVLSDTHGYLDERVFDHFANCDEIWHAGDIGSTEIVSQLQAFKPTRIVFGNIDTPQVRAVTDENLHFEVEGFRVWITHIGGAPPRYNPQVMPTLKSNTPDIFVCGHSHILRVIRDKSLNNMLYINPGAAGREGFHKFRTLLRFNLHEGLISQMEAIELGKRGAVV
ncbi:putative phosphoesterase [Dyadobacter sp. BE34]|uniref:Phosphoesterase n=1 Tax=Dyadobacter fermentans TaxID=94254 RepID=A0ABU1R4G9_9BACT|nr:MULTISPECIES: metallophosphoesterase family protein [Dyadobacter]MDR6807475.1 putative phosphoesterase [Dyadobacter fermentans]MDR7045216.1 putative phosphoesterase [Dyadobacter sp. BE242]MDR7199047.1 putative phosphoesterase [Dyadobacter sp. BE34]MDR7217007.1 putative phosphoesterase [Dyadobacter sp. BE31]MDR7264940.1 putative phosphoesterase [Dyadobacter sp. BE32]